MAPRDPSLDTQPHSARLGPRDARYARRVGAVMAVALMACAGEALCTPSGAPPTTGAPAAPAPSATPVDATAALPAIKAPALRAVVTIAPLRSFVEPLLPEGSKIRVLMQPGKSEHGYEFTPSDLRALAEADVVVLVGLNLEPAVERTLKSRKDASRRVVRFSDVAGIKVTSGEDGDQEGHDEHGHAAPAGARADHDDHEHGEECDHGPTDPHLWLDPMLCGTLVDAVRAAVDAELTERNALSDEAKAALAARQADLHARIARVDRAWRDAAPIIAANPIVTHHNAFPRLAERYNLRIAAVIREVATADPSPAQVANVARAIRQQNVRTIYVEPQFDRRLADRIAKAANVSVATLDPLGDGDWFKLMDTNLESLRANSSSPTAGPPTPTTPSTSTPAKPK